MYCVFTGKLILYNNLFHSNSPMKREIYYILSQAFETKTSQIHFLKKYFCVVRISLRIYSHFYTTDLCKKKQDHFIFKVKVILIQLN